jgi:uncharacterized protein involved in response to NO
MGSFRPNLKLSRLISTNLWGIIHVDPESAKPATFPPPDETGGPQASARPELPLADAPGAPSDIRPLLRSGFRPFFIGAALSASASLGLWLHWLILREAAPGRWAGLHWHRHEMVFGFVAAAIAGFALTAVPNWTGSARLRSTGLGLLFAVWAAGRVAMWSAAWLPPLAVAFLDLLFLPLLAIAVGWPILRARKPRNYPVVGILLALAFGNLAMHLDILQLVPGLARHGLHAALYLAILLLALISGRIVPLFTRNTLRRIGREAEVVSSPSLERILAVTLILACVLDLVVVAAGLRAWVLGLAALLLALRQWRWRSWEVRDRPILWVLHVGHLWLILGFALRGLAAWTPSVPGSAGLHALGAGAVGTMVIGVMSRVSLGHTGREIEADRTTSLAYGLVILGASIRVAASLFSAQIYLPGVVIGGALWGAGFLLFLIVYGPMLCRARPDGGEG